MIVTNLVKTPLKTMIIRRLCCSSEVDLNTYLRLSSETLESLNDRFSELIEDHEDRLRGADTSLADGVLTVQLSELGTYVINKHLQAYRRNFTCLVRQRIVEIYSD